MANALFHKLADNTYVNTNLITNLRVVQDTTDANYHPQYTFNGDTWISIPGAGSPTLAQAQTNLDNFAASANAGGVGP